MTSDADQRFTLHAAGKRLSIETRRAGIETAARLWIDDKQVAEGKNWFDPVTLTHDDLTVIVRSTWLGQVTGCGLVRADGEEIPFTPPPGSHAARLEHLASEHPVLYASRHVAIALVQLGIGLLGIGALVWTLFGELLPRLDVPDLVPDIGIGLPGWLRTILGIPDRIAAVPIGWARSGYDRLSENIDLPDWSSLTSTLWSWFQDFRIWIPVVIAVFVAIEEVQRRKARHVSNEPATPLREETAGADGTASKKPEATPEEPALDDAIDTSSVPPAPPGIERRPKQTDGSRAH